MAPVATIIIFSFLIHHLNSEIYLNPLFSDNMVLQSAHQSGYLSYIYGISSPNETITLTGNIPGNPYQVISDNNGYFQIVLNPQWSYTAKYK